MHGRLVVVLAWILIGGFAADAQGQTKSGSAKAAALAKKKAKAKKPAAKAKPGQVAPAATSAPPVAPLAVPLAAPTPAATPVFPPPPAGFRAVDAHADSAALPAAPLPAPAPIASAAAAPPAASAPLVETAAAADSEPLGLEVALKLAMLVPSGNTAGAIARADSSAEAGKSAFASGALAVRYRLPMLERALSINLEGGYYRLSGEGKRGFVNDPDFGPELSYRWKMDAIPVLFGLAYELPLRLPVALAPAAGCAAVHVSSQTTYLSSAGEITDAPQEGWALGFYLGVEAAMRLGPGSLLAEVRYLNARTDLGFQELYAGPYNAEPGDVQGTNLLLGYRFAF